MVNVLQPGNALKCAGYCLYSCSTILVLTIGHGVYGFTVDPLIGEFVLTHRDIKIPEVRLPMMEKCSCLANTVGIERCHTQRVLATAQLGKNDQRPRVCANSETHHICDILLSNCLVEKARLHSCVSRRNLWSGQGNSGLKIF